MRIRSFFFFGLFCVMLGSCINYKKVTLFQDIPQTGAVHEDLANFNPILIQPNDILSININSLNPEASAMFNPISTQQNGGTNGNNQQIGFTVDQTGAIRLPFIDTVHVAGLTTTQARDVLIDKLKIYLKEPMVSLRIINFKVGVFGDVAVPGLYSVPFERMTLVEAIVTAGDLKVTGLRNNVLLIRENQGRRQFIRFDLNSRETFTSPYFYLKTNDIVYVEPNTAVIKKDNIFGNIGLITSLISLVLILTRL